MHTMDFHAAVQRLIDALNKMPSEEKKFGVALTDYAKTQNAYHQRLYEHSRKDVEIFASRPAYEKDPRNSSLLKGIDQLLQQLRAAPREKVVPIAQALLEKSMLLPLPQPMSFSIKNLPPEISIDVKADINELEQCFKAKCYRASIILCGRILETALHWKYYQATKNDLLEKSPGIGLGNIIAKLKENNIMLDPGLTNQIHLINQVRIFSVHKKSEAFHPTRQQTQATILYTLDALEKLFG